MCPKLVDDQLVAYGFLVYGNLNWENDFINHWMLGFPHNSQVPKPDNQMIHLYPIIISPQKLWVFSDLTISQDVGGVRFPKMTLSPRTWHWKMHPAWGIPRGPEEPEDDSYVDRVTQ